MRDQSDLFGDSPAPSPGSQKAPLERGKTGDNTPSPVRSGPLVKKDHRGRAPVAPPHRGPLRNFVVHFDKAGPDATDAEEIKEGLKTARDALATWAGVVAGYDKTLAPYWSQKDWLTQELVNTHGQTMAKNGMPMLVYNLHGREARKALFAALDALSVKYGPILTKRRDASREVKLLEQEIERINKRLDQLTKRKKK